MTTSIYGIIHLLTATFPAVFGTIYSERPGWASMHFICIGIGTISGGIVGGLLVEHFYKVLSMRNGGIAKPEYRIYAFLFIVWIPPVGLSLFGWCTYYGVVSNCPCRFHFAFSCRADVLGDVG